MHRAALVALDRNVMRKAVGFPCCPLVGWRENGALSDKVRGGVALVQLCEDWSRALRPSAVPVTAWDLWRSWTPRSGCLW